MNVLNRFLKSVKIFPDNTALELNDEKYTYKQLWNKSLLLSASIRKNNPSTYIGILAYRETEVYTGILASLACGKAYMPFNPKFPVERILKMIHISGCTTIIVGPSFYTRLPEIEGRLYNKVNFIAPGLSIPEPNVCSDNVTYNSVISIKEKDDIPVYLLFTSGTTGEPKGISITHENLYHFIDFFQRTYPVYPEDRCSQAFDTTFDPSMHDIWVTWNAGATLCVVPETDLFSPARFIIKKKLTTWYSVPSVISFMIRTKCLKPNIFNDLRYSIFAGEALMKEQIKAWSMAAPKSKLLNLYGPTEATITVSHFSIDKSDFTIPDKEVSVPIGYMNDEEECKIIDEDENEVEPGIPGELIITGPQICHGYFNDQQSTDCKFIKYGMMDKRIWYKTGDLVKRDSHNCLCYLGRLDQQIKIRGYRVELTEIELMISRIAKVQNVVAIPWPIVNNIIGGIVAFCNKDIAGHERGIIKKLSSMLPEYMIPKRLYYLPEFPLNINGKTDRNQLIKILEEV